MLARACEIFTERTQQRLDYQAETSGAIMLRALERILITRRLDAPKEQKEALWESQGGLCADCGDLLGLSFETAKYDVAHKRVRHQSIGDEGNDTSNLELKCRTCHTRETEQQDAATRSHGHTLASHPSPLVAELFQISGKPKQQSGGMKCSGDDIYRLDARGSRPNALWEYPYRLPIFSPIDEPERCVDEDGIWTRPPQEWDYIWVAASGQDLGYNLDDPHDADFCMPYDGEHLYPIHVVMTLLKANVITKDHCRWGLRATRGVDPKDVKAAATKLQDCITEAAKEYLPLLRHLYPPKEDIENPDCYDVALVKKQTKGAMLEMLGILNKEDRYQWTIYRSSCEDDVPPSEHIRVVRDKTHPGELEMRLLPTRRQPDIQTNRSSHTIR